MKIKLISHASVIFTTEDCRIWTDPWLFGKAFNDSWSLDPPPAWDPSWLNDITLLWISHEHPDHFHIPTLKSLPAEFKGRVKLLYQQNNSDKMWEAFRRFGFQNFQSLPHRKLSQVTKQTEVYCHQIGNMDSMLAVRDGSLTVLNVNDCEINTSDCRRVIHDLHRVDVVLNQFSLAGSTGSPDHVHVLKRVADNILKIMIENHKDLGAKVTIPIASFMYFSCTDNRHINDSANRISDVYRHFNENGLETAILYPGDQYIGGEPWNSQAALEHFEKDSKQEEQRQYSEPVIVRLEEIASALKKTSERLHDRYTALVVRRLKPVMAFLPDLNKTIRFSVANGKLEEVASGTEADITVNSQPLLFAFSSSFGIQTLGVSGRYFIHRNHTNWRRHRILFAMDNAEIFLRPKYLFSRKNIRFLIERFPGAWNQMRYKLARMGI